MRVKVRKRKDSPTDKGEQSSRIGATDEEHYPDEDMPPEQQEYDGQVSEDKHQGKRIKTGLEIVSALENSIAAENRHIEDLVRIRDKVTSLHNEDNHTCCKNCRTPSVHDLPCEKPRKQDMHALVDEPSSQYIPIDTHLKYRITDDALKVRVGQLAMEIQVWVSQYIRAHKQADGFDLNIEAFNRLAGRRSMNMDWKHLNTGFLCQFVVAKCLLPFFQQDHFFGLPSTQPLSLLNDTFQVFGVSICASRAPVLADNRTDASGTAAFRKLRSSMFELLREDKQDLLNASLGSSIAAQADIIESYLQTILRIPPGMKINQHTTKLYSIVTNATNLSQTLQVQHAEYQIEFPGGHNSLFDSTFIQDAQYSEDHENEGKPISLIVFPALIKRSDDAGEAVRSNDECRNDFAVEVQLLEPCVIFKARAVCKYEEDKNTQ